MVFCLLSLGNRAHVIEICPVDEACIVEAKELLADINRNWTGIETRRKMFYYLARGRIAELTKQHQNYYLDKVNTQSQHPYHIKGEEQEREIKQKNYALLGSQRLETISIRTFDDDETIPKLRLYSPVALSSTSTSAGNSDADSFAKPECVSSSENPYPTQEQLYGSYETRIPSAGRETARITPCQTGERLPDSHVDYQKEGNTSVEHLNVYQLFKNSDIFENVSSLDSKDLFDDWHVTCAEPY
ncbi:hypothetical protein MAR_023599 [Mya arenaria]|uniref:Uncharacterized protein n=1 Tax=Mya arenaria TaxID=6604 RepID=A0ABY7DNE5_MYAAR|nr:hypothetical protein MAR_023599 [Mya arenaria]